MWREIDLIGRDAVLEREVYPRLRHQTPFLLVGTHGVGKTALLEWSYDHCPGGKNAFCSGHWTVRENLKAICEGWGLQAVDDEGRDRGLSRAQMAWLEKAIMKVPTNTGVIFFDDVEKATPAMLRRVKLLRERCVLFLAGTPPFSKEELKRVLWGVKELPIGPIQGADRLALAQAILQHEGASLSVSEMGHASRGLPGRMVAMARGEVEEESPRVEGEELNLAPVLLIGVGVLCIVRHLGSGLDRADLVLGGLGLGLAVFLRFVLYRGMK
jgi:hypothetical protein